MSSAVCPERARTAEKSHEMRTLNIQHTLSDNISPLLSNGLMIHHFYKIINNGGVVYLQCDSEDKDGEDNCSV